MKAFEPYKLGDLTVRNRLVMAPMTTYSGNDDFTVSEEELAYYKTRSSTLGLVITAAVSVNDQAQAFEKQITIKEDKYIHSMTRLATAIHEGGAKAIIQLHHGGRMNDPKLYDDYSDIVSASAIKAERDTLVTPRALTEDEVYQTIDDFMAATKRSIEAGFDGVELHGANTYLLQQFFSPHSNQRTDTFGGSLSKRMTFALLLIDAVKSVVDQYAKKPFIIGYRFSPEELENPGITVDDTKVFLEVLKKTPLDYLHISLRQFDQAAMREGESSETIVSRLQESLNHAIPLIGVGQIKTQSDVRDCIENGYDMAAVGMAILADPFWGKTVSSGDTPSTYIKKETMPKPLYERLYKNREYFSKKGYTF